MLDVKKPSFAAYVDILKERDSMDEKRRHLYAECLEAYDEYAGA
jgi:hypothetical protein